MLGIVNTTWSDSSLEMIVSDPQSLAGRTVTDVASRDVKWTIKRRSKLQEDQRYLPQINHCPRLIQGMEVKPTQQIKPEVSSPNLQRYVPKGERSVSSTLKDSEYVSTYSKDVLSYERPPSCVRQAPRQIIQQHVTEYQSPSLSIPKGTGTWWSINANTQRYSNTN